MYKNEIWKIIKEYSDYQISNLGRIKSFKYNKINGKILKINKDSKNYFFINLWRNGTSKNKLIHVLVYETFYNDKLKLNECVHHKDENKENNYYDNLEKMTKFDHNSFHNKEKYHSDETKNKIRNKMKGKNIGKLRSNETKNKISQNHADFKGECHPRHKLTKVQIIQIKMLFKLNFKNRYISENYNISIGQVSHIRNNLTWSHINI